MVKTNGKAAKRAAQAGNRPEYVDSAYGDGGNCWTSTEDASNNCDSACETVVDGSQDIAQGYETTGDLDTVPEECN